MTLIISISTFNQNIQSGVENENIYSDKHPL